jgi:hypothetical protein
MQPTILTHPVEKTPTLLPPFVEILPAAPYRELHRRVVAAPIEDVWPHCLDVSAREIRALGPLMALRSLPARIMGKGAESASTPRALLDVFTDEGWVLLRRDSEPRDGRASVMFAGAGRFWSVRNDAPIAFPDGGAFVDFDEPGHVKVIARLDAIDLGDGTTRIETETLVRRNRPGKHPQIPPILGVDQTAERTDPAQLAGGHRPTGLS